MRVDVLDIMQNLARRQTVSELVNTYNVSVAKVREGFRLCAEAERDLSLSLDEDPDRNYRFRISPYYRVNFGDSDSVIEHLRQGFWGAIVERLGVRRVLSVERARELDKTLADFKALPDVTVENVMNFVLTWEGQLEDRFNEAVLEVYNVLRPRRTKLKTNSPYGIGKKVILCVLDRNTYSDRFEVSHYWQKEVTALENVFSFLDGHGLRSGAQYWSDLADAIYASPNGVGQTKYFSFKCCKNGNLHLTFLREDLVHKLNVIVGSTMLGVGDTTK